MFNEFLKFEKENRLFLEEYEGVRYWHLIRDWVYNNLVNSGEETDTINSRINKGGGATKKAYVILTNMLTHIFQLTRQKKTVDVLVSRAYGYRLVDGKPKDIFMEPLKMEEYLNYKVYEYSQFRDITSRSKYSSCYADFIVGVRTLYYLLAQKLHGCKDHNKNDDIKRIESMVSSLNKTFGIEVDNVTVIGRIAYSAMAYKIYYKKARKVLKKTEPKAVILICAYGIRNYAMCRATKDLGIPTIELQHGVIGPWHIDYNYEDREDSFFYYPDYLFTFGEYWNDTCKTPEGCKKIAIGYAYQEAFIQSRKATASEDNTVVFYSNGTNEMAEFCKAFNDLAKHEYRVIFKYHPTECGVKEYMQLKNQGIEIIDRPEEVYNFIADYTHHVGSGTTVLFEALLMDRLTYVIDDVGYKYFENLIKKNIVEAVYTPHDLLRRMEALLLLNTQKESFDKEYFMEKNVVQNFRRTMDNILSSRMPDNHTN